MNQKTTTVSSLKKMNDFVRTSNPKAPQADLTNAAHLMGDAEEDGDADYGDASEEGDADGSPLAMMNALIGDASGMGGPKIIGNGPIAKALRARRARQDAAKKKVANQGKKNTIDNQLEARRAMGKLPRNHQFRFFQASGAVLNSAQISPTESFVSDMLKTGFDRQQSDTPFEVEIANGTFGGVTWTVTANGVATNRFYVAVLLRCGINVLNANPGTIFNVTGTMPTINGNLTISTPFSFTLLPGYYASVLIFPWQLVTNKALWVLGQYSNAAPITFSITGLPSTAVVNLTVPGSQHTWTIGMRNRLL